MVPTAGAGALLLVLVPVVVVVAGLVPLGGALAGALLVAGFAPLAEALELVPGAGVLVLEAPLSVAGAFEVEGLVPEVGALVVEAPPPPLPPVDAVTVLPPVPVPPNRDDPA